MPHWLKSLSLKRLRDRPSKRHWREDRQAILEFNRSVMLIADPESLMPSITARVKEIFGTDRIVILRAHADDGIFAVAFSTGWQAEELHDIQLLQRGRLTKWLRANETPLIVKEDSDAFNYLSPVEREILTRLAVRICVPLLALNRLTGMMLLSSTDEDLELDSDDLNLLQMLMSQASIALENGYLYQEQRERLSRLYRAEKLATAGQLAASVAHEIRNPLTSIRSTVQYLKSCFEEDTAKRQLIEGVISEVDRINHTVSSLLNLTRSTTIEPERVALGRLIYQAILVVQAQGQKQAVEISWAPLEIELYIMGDQSQLKQLLLNLMLNAFQAMPDGGRLIIKLRSKNDPLSEKVSAVISLTDNGCGIPADKIERVFDPFFTTKQGGTGLGLPTSHTIAREHGGELEINSREGEGTAVMLKFPVVK